MSKGKSGSVYLVGAGPGDAGLLTVRGAELLNRAEVVICDALVNAELLRLAPSSAEIIFAGKRVHEAGLSQDQINRLLVAHAQEGKLVVRLKGGDPYIFGRGAEEAVELASAGIRFEVVPGVSSFSSAASYAGIPLTHRDYASAFTVLTGHEDPAKTEVAIDWTQVARIHGTKVVLMGVERITAIVSALVNGGLSTATPIALVRWGTTGRQQTLESTLSDIAAQVELGQFSGPAVMVIGEVVRLRSKLNWFERRPLFGRRIVVTRAREQAGELSRRLTELGADAVEIPTIRVAPPDDRHPMLEALEGLGEYDWIVFTSANGVSAFFDYLLRAFEDIRALGLLRIAAVGPGTAARLKELHLRAHAVPDEFSARNIAKSIAEHESLDNLRVLVARAQVANPDLCRELEEMGAIVDDIPFYQTVSETEDRIGALAHLESEGADWITFTSGSTVENFHVRLALPRLLERFPQMQLASIGPETSKALTALGLKAAVEATPHTLDGLVAGLVRATKRAR